MMVNPTPLQRGLKRCRRTADIPFSGLLMSRWRLSTRLNARAGRAGALAAAALPEQTATCCARRSVARQQGSGLCELDTARGEISVTTGRLPVRRTYAPFPPEICRAYVDECELCAGMSNESCMCAGLRAVCWHESCVLLLCLRVVKAAHPRSRRAQRPGPRARATVSTSAAPPGGSHATFFRFSNNTHEHTIARNALKRH